jgi:hypothetical protein
MTYLDSIVDRLFWSKVQKSDGCWEWQGHRTNWNYGYFTFRGDSIPAHRFSVELASGKRIPAGMVICHKCDNPPCVRPDHLFIGTHADNMRDMAEKGRNRRRVVSQHSVGRPRLSELSVIEECVGEENHCWRGHEFTPENTYTDPRGVKICRICNRWNKRQYKAKKRAACIGIPS